MRHGLETRQDSFGLKVLSCRVNHMTTLEVRLLAVQCERHNHPTALEVVWCEPGTRNCLSEAQRHLGCCSAPTEQVWEDGLLISLLISGRPTELHPPPAWYRHMFSLDLCFATIRLFTFCRHHVSNGPTEVGPNAEPVPGRVSAHLYPVDVGLHLQLLHQLPGLCDAGRVIARHGRRHSGPLCALSGEDREIIYK